MNIFQVIFWLVWCASAGYLLYQLRGYLRRKKNKKSCINCRHYKGGTCEDLQFLRDRDLPFPVYCSGFEGKGRKKGKRNTSPASQEPDPEQLQN